MNSFQKERNSHSKGCLKQFTVWTVVPVLIILFVGCVVLWLSDGVLSRTHYWQIQSNQFIALNHALSALPALFWFNLTLLGDALVLFPLLSFLLIWKPQAWASMFGAIPLSTLLSVGGKHLMAVPRPAAVLDGSLFIIIGDSLTSHNSLPSGHSITVFAVATAVFATFMLVPRKRLHWFWFMIVCFFSALLCLSRVAVGAHWSLDLLIGAAFGVIGGLSGVILSGRYQRWWQWITQFNGRLIFGISLLIWSMLLIHRALESQFDGLVVLWLSALLGSMTSLCLLYNLKTHRNP